VLREEVLRELQPRQRHAKLGGSEPAEPLGQEDAQEMALLRTVPRAIEELEPLVRLHSTAGRDLLEDAPPMLDHGAALGRGGHTVSHVQPARELAARGRTNEQAEPSRAHLARRHGAHSAALQWLGEERVVVERRLRLLPRPQAIQLLQEVALPRGGKAPLLRGPYPAETTLPISQLCLIGCQSLVEGLEGRVRLQ